MASTKKTKADILSQSGLDDVVLELYSTDDSEWQDPAGGYVTDEQVRQNQVLLDHGYDGGLVVLTERIGREAGRIVGLTHIASVTTTPKTVMDRNGRTKTINEYEFSYGPRASLDSLNLTRRHLDDYTVSGAPIDAIRALDPKVMSQLLGSVPPPPKPSGELAGGASTTVTRARRNQSRLRDAVAQRQGHTCAVTGTAVPAALEAAHLVPWSETERQDPDECTLLRADIHALEERGLLRFATQHEWPTTELHPSLRSDPTYGPLHGRALALAPAMLPPEDVLRHHYKAQSARVDWSDEARG